jgi:single-strand DNA-binding protein
MSGETVITIVGNLVDDVELRFVSSGAAVAKFRIASTPRVFDKQSNAWQDGESLFLSCSVWRQAAENCAETLQKGMRVIVQGRLKSRSYEDREGVKRTVFEVDVDEIGPSLRSATAKVTKASSGGGGRQEFQQSRQQQQQSAGSGDPWGSAAQQAGQAGGSGWDTEPPF